MSHRDQQRYDRWFERLQLFRQTTDEQILRELASEISDMEGSRDRYWLAIGAVHNALLDWNVLPVPEPLDPTLDTFNERSTPST